MTQAAEYTLSSPPPCPTNRDQLSSSENLLPRIVRPPSSVAGLYSKPEEF